MQKILYILVLFASIWGCKKDSNSIKQTDKITERNYFVINISRSIFSYDSVRTDSILPSSYLSKNGIIEYLPLLSLIADTTNTVKQGYEDYIDTLDIISGDSIKLSINLKHKLFRGIGFNGPEYGIYLNVIQYPHIGGFGTLICEDTTSEIISFQAR